MEVREKMEQKIVEYLKNYFEEDGVKRNVEKYGAKKTIKVGIKELIENLNIQEEYIRKEMSVYIGRIISEEEFARMTLWGLVPC